MTKRNIMAAILQVCGPVTIHAVLTRNYRFLNKSTAAQFVEAGEELQALGLGTVVNLKPRTRVFVKKSPNEATPILLANPDLCCWQYYEQRYSKPLSKSITLHTRHQLSAMRLVPAKQMM